MYILTMYNIQYLHAKYMKLWPRLHTITTLVPLEQYSLQLTKLSYIAHLSFSF